MKKKKINVTTKEDLAKFADGCFKDLKKFDGCTIEFNKELFSFVLKLKGENYDSTITTPVMKHLLSI